MPTYRPTSRTAAAKPAASVIASPQCRVPSCATTRSTTPATSTAAASACRPPHRGGDGVQADRQRDREQRPVSGPLGQDGRGQQGPQRTPGRATPGAAAAPRPSGPRRPGWRPGTGDRVRRLAEREVRQRRRACDDGAADVEGPGSQWPRSRVLGRLPAGHVLSSQLSAGKRSRRSRFSGRHARPAPGARLRSSGTVAAGQIRAASRTIAAANGSMGRMTIGPIRPHPLGGFQADEEQGREPAWNGAASPQGDRHEQRREIFAREVDVQEDMAELGIEDRHQQLRGRVRAIRAPWRRRRGWDRPRR